MRNTVSKSGGNFLLADVERPWRIEGVHCEVESEGVRNTGL